MSKYSEAYNNLNNEQRQAVDMIDGPVLVIAGPGTGKTQLLTTRIAHILAVTDARPDNILCLTFTDAAAVNMRQRLNGLVGQDAYGVTISTYHAFGSDILQRYPEYFADFADLQAADALRIDQLLRQAQAIAPYSNPLKHEVFLKDLKTLISDYKRALLTPADIKQIAKANQSFVAAATELVQASLGGMAKMTKASIPLFENLLVASSKLPLVNDLPVASLPSLWLSSLESAVETAVASGKQSALTAWKNDWLAKDQNGNYIAAGGEAARRQLAAANLYEDYLKLLRANNLYDYDDMILEAVRGLQSHPDLRYSLQERFQYLLLDEFQDTNGAQLKLVELLTDNPINEQRPNVLAVGDDDQAIFAFQGANYSHMLQFYTMYRNVLVVPLTQNYRSQPEILAFAEAISGQITERLHHNFTAINKTLLAANQRLAALALERLEFTTDLTQNAWVSNRIHELIASGLPASQIAIIAPKHKFLEPLIPFLQQSSVPVHYEKREDILTDPAINQLLLMSQLVCALAKQNHQLANQLWPQVLSLEFWKLPTSTIWQLSWQTGRDNNWTQELCELPATKHIALFFIRLSLQAGHEPLETSLDYLIGSTALDLQEVDIEPVRSPFYEYYFGNETPKADESVGFWHVLSNLTVLRQRLRNYRNEQDSMLTLTDFVQFAAAHLQAHINILNTNPYQESADAVQVMTAFKAKGQEFSAVFIIAATDEAWGSKASNQASRISIPENLRPIRHAGATPDERLRLLFVALTRAKSQLYITSYESDFSGRRQSHIKYFDEVSDEAGIISPLLPTDHQTVLRPDITAPPATRDMTTYWATHRHMQGVTDPKLRDLLQDRLGNFQLSATQLNRFTDITINGPNSFLMRDLLKFPTGSSLPGTYGDIIHTTLHWLQTQLKLRGSVPSLQATINKLSTAVHDKYLNDQDSIQLIERGSICMQAYLEQRANQLQPTDFSEFNFRQEGVFVGPAHLTGSIDRLIIDEATKTATVVDFKTGRSDSRWTADLRALHRRQQLYFYKLLVENSNTFHDYVVTDAYLEYVEPDDSGLINELHIVFKEPEMDQFKILISSVWQHVHELNFPDITAYPENLKGVQQFQADLQTGNI